MNNAALYNKYHDFHTTYTIRHMKEYGQLMKWKDNAAVLDIGCGDGGVTAHVIRESIPASCSLVGCDVSAEMVGFARAHYSSPALHFQLLDIAGLLPPRWTSRFQHVLSFYAINWVIDQEAAFKNIYELMDTNGTALLVIVSELSMFDAFRKLKHMKKWSTWIQDVEKFISPYHDCDDRISILKNIVYGAGFAKAEIKYKTFSFPFDDINSLRGTFKGISPFGLPEEKLDEYIDDLFQEMHINDVEKYKYPKSVLDGVLNVRLLELFMEK